MLLVKNGTITTHLKLDTWKEPGQKKHIKDPAKHDFKRYSTDVRFWETACTGARAQTLGWSFTFKPEESTKVSPQIVFIMNFQRFTWQRFPFY